MKNLNFQGKRISPNNIRKTQVMMIRMRSYITQGIIHPTQSRLSVSNLLKSIMRRKRTIWFQLMKVLNQSSKLMKMKSPRKNPQGKALNLICISSRSIVSPFVSSFEINMVNPSKTISEMLCNFACQIFSKPIELWKMEKRLKL